ncbi:MAG: sulfite exporter TauE/SafE family protein [Candidatus Marinimicrobia bacterium]|nr:sulfite exporter TauE/SafE family protein [Candidatus Neomarinimicrobiota bacterium]MCF7850346.1 sulfite exporter TauE/SafE family protein [Candidatus Neomarinimicrobiota bacterium]MCF7904945.1 sulfite exporter TauE/SafE family protein [Candidatus Neomarinimicrobiota bacterium]
METIDLISVITIAFLGSFGHCIGMCGGIVIAYSSAGAKKEKKRSSQALDHILYSLGRVTTYTTLGAIFGFLGGVVVFDRMTNGVLWIVAGAAMILAGMALSGKFRFMPALESSVASSKWYQKRFRALIQSEARFGHYLLGMLNGLLPCGFVYVFAISAASTASPIYGALVMFIFGLSTIPALFSLGFFVGLFKEFRFRHIMTQLAAWTVIGYGLYTLYNGVGWLTEPTRTILECH